MTKQKVGVIVGSCFGAVLLAVGGFWLGTHRHSLNAAANIDGAASISGDTSQQASSNSVPLNQEPKASDSGGLSVGTSSGAGSLGQLGSTGGQNPTGGSTSGSGGSSSSSSSQGIDPSTFSQYDKYKSDNQALFGDMQKGDGAELTANHKAAVYYKGWLTNGQLFDESRTGSDGKLQPFIFTLGAHQVIAGWEEGLTGMKVGGTRLLVIPPSVGYGAQGQGSIPGNAVLVFEVQLVDVQ